MAVTTSPSVTLFAYGVSVDLTDKVLGVSITTRAPLGQLGTTDGFLDLDNTDGRFTPGGGGTYTNTDWFAHAIQLDAEVTDGTTTHTAALGYGIVTGFDIVDDGVTSFVRLTFDDAHTVGGSALSSIEYTGTNYAVLSPAQFVRFAYRDLTTTTYVFDGATLPDLGHPDQPDTSVSQRSKLVTTEYATNQPPTSASFLIDDAVTFTNPAKDFLNTSVLPSGPFTAYPTTVYTTTSGGDTFADYGLTILGPWHVRDDQTATVGSGYRYDFTFHETAAANRLAFRDTARRYNADELVNEATITTLPTPSGIKQETASNTASVTAYGSRARYVSQGLAGDISTLASNEPWVQADAIVRRYANMAPDPTYHLVKIDTTAKMVEALAPNSLDAWAHLLDIRDGLYQYMTVTYTPTAAGSTQTVDGVIYSRQIRMTPTDTTVTLELYPRGVLAAFILDDAVVGVLDQDMLG